MDYFDLGTHSRPVTTSSDDAQTWFDRGLNWLFCFNHGEAAACFQRAIDADHKCAMAHWGLSYALGPNYNLPWHRYDEKGRAKALAAAYDALQGALTVAGDASAFEQAMIKALQARYPQRDLIEDMSAWDKAYTTEMRSVFEDNKDDREARTVFVEAIMNETPWKMWNLETGDVADGAGTAEARAVLEDAFQNMPESWEHPGLLHLYVHLMEMSPFPEKALRQGDRLRTIMPDGGHLVHMPTHIDVQCGAYRDTLAYNQQALVADRKFLAYSENPGVYLMYIIHNFHFAIYGAMFLGQYRAAIEAAEELISTVPEAVLRIESPPMGDFLEGYLAMKQHVMVRFGRWQEIIDQTLPADQELYCATTAMMMYAKTVAHSALGNVDDAESHKTSFLKAKARVKEGRRVHNNTVADLLEVAEAMLDGELEYRKGNFDDAYAHLRRSVSLDDALPYDEPWGWMQPARHALGALLLEQGRADEAEAVYRADLGLDGSLSRACRHLENVWSLHGLHECLMRRGATAEAAMIKQRLDLAQARADVPIKASCFCRQVAMAAE
ncbi:MAG: hypothetical protein AAGK00_05460 [Pseudomonadota bacterium]